MDTYILLGVWLWTVVPSQAADCSGLFEVMLESEHCSGAVTSYKTEALTGQLTYLKKDPMCSIYRNAVQCLDELVQECQAGQHADEAQAQNVLDDLTGGFGKFCDDPDYFDKYTAHAQCYARVSPQTSSCLDTFNAVLDSEMAEIPYNHEEAPMCRAKEDLEACVQQAVRPTCGQTAADLYVDLCGHQIPASMVGHCDPTADQLKTTPTSGTVPGASVALGLCTVCSLLLLTL